MAGLVVCDICENETDINATHDVKPFVKAIVRVAARAIDRSTVTPIETLDVCEKHIQEAVITLWFNHKVVPNLHDIVLIKV